MGKILKKAGKPRSSQGKRKAKPKVPPTRKVSPEIEDTKEVVKEVPKVKKTNRPITDEVALQLISELEEQINIQIPKAQRASKEVLTQVGFSEKEIFISPKALAALQQSAQKKSP